MTRPSRHLRQLLALHRAAHQLNIALDPKTQKVVMPDGRVLWFV